MTDKRLQKVRGRIFGMNRSLIISTEAEANLLPDANFLLDLVDTQAKQNGELQKFTEQLAKELREAAIEINDQDKTLIKLEVVMREFFYFDIGKEKPVLNKLPVSLQEKVRGLYAWLKVTG